MRTSSKKPESPQSANSAKIKTPHRSHVEHTENAHRGLHLQRTIGNQGVRRLLEHNQVQTTSKNPMLKKVSLAKSLGVSLHSYGKIIQKAPEDEADYGGKLHDTKRRSVITFIVGNDSYYRSAHKYWKQRESMKPGKKGKRRRTRRRAKTDYLVKKRRVLSFEDILTYLRTHRLKNNRPWGEINIVVHASDQGSMKMRIRSRSKAKMSIENLTKALDKGYIKPLPPKVIDDSTNINIHGCAIGRSEEMLELISRAFGNSATVYAPKHLQYYSYNRIIKGKPAESLEQYWTVEFPAKENMGSTKQKEQKLSAAFSKKYGDQFDEDHKHKKNKNWHKADYTVEPYWDKAVKKAKKIRKTSRYDFIFNRIKLPGPLEESYQTPEKTRYGALKKKYKTLEKDHQALKLKRYEPFQQKHKALDEKHKKLEQKLADLQKKYELQNQAYLKLQSNYDILKERHSSLSKSYKSHEKTYKKLERRYKKLERLHAKLQKAETKRSKNPRAKTLKRLEKKYLKHKAKQYRLLEKKYKALDRAYHEKQTAKDKRHGRLKKKFQRLEKTHKIKTAKQYKQFLFNFLSYERAEDNDETLENARLSAKTVRRNIKVLKKNWKLSRNAARKMTRRERKAAYTNIDQQAAQQMIQQAEPLKDAAKALSKKAKHLSEAAKAKQDEASQETDKTEKKTLIRDAKKLKREAKSLKSLAKRLHKSAMGILRASKKRLSFNAAQRSAKQAFNAANKAASRKRKQNARIRTKKYMSSVNWSWKSFQMNRSETKGLTDDRPSITTEFEFDRLTQTISNPFIPQNLEQKMSFLKTTLDEKKGDDFFPKYSWRVKTRAHPKRVAFGKKQKIAMSFHGEKYEYRITRILRKDGKIYKPSRTDATHYGSASY